MKRVITLVTVPTILAVLIGCNFGQNQPVAVDLKASLVNVATLGFRSIDMGSNIIVDEYSVTFYKIEIGNSEEDKFTLWESSAGVAADLVASDLTFDDTNGEVGLPVPGEYAFCRVTIGETIHLAGSVGSVPGTADTTVTGNWGANSDGKAVFIFGTEGSGASGDFLLTEPVVVAEGSVLTFTVNINGTVSYDTAINLDPPELTFSDG